MSVRQKLIPLIEMVPKKVDGQTTYVEQRAPHLFVDPKTGIIYFEAKIKGKRIKFSTQEINPTKAKRIANEELDYRLGKKKSHIRTLVKEELPFFKKFKEGEGHKYDTMNNIYRAIEDIEEYWGNSLPSEITDDSCAEWVAWWKENKTIQMENAIKYMRNFCNYLSRKVVNGHPLLPAVPKITDPDRKKIRAQRKKKKERIFTHDEFMTILNTAATITEKVAALIMYTMATRVTETLEMSFDQEVCNVEGRWIYKWRVGQNKADLEGWHEFHPALYTALNDLCEIRKSEETLRLFPQSINNQAPLKSQQIDWKGWRVRASLGWHWTAHTFRHTCLSNLFNDPKNPQLLICKLYRISYKEAEETYVKPTQEGRELMRESIRVNL
jgi:integrase